MRQRSACTADRAKESADHDPICAPEALCERGITPGGPSHGSEAPPYSIGPSISIGGAIRSALEPETSDARNRSPPSLTFRPEHALKGLSWALMTPSERIETMPSEQQQLDELLDRFKREYPDIAAHAAAPTVSATPIAQAVEATVTQGTTTAASDLSYLGASTS